MANDVSESKFYDLQQESIDLINEQINKIALPFNLKIKIIGNKKLKSMIKLSKINDINEYMTGYSMLIQINEDYLEAFEGDSASILIYQELDRLSFDIAKGTFKIGKYPLQTTAGVLKKYGIEAVAQANQLSDLYKSQKDDNDSDQKDATKKVKANKKSAVNFD
jgi:hypothetical protein